jgi:hypothetical protein
MTSDNDIYTAAQAREWQDGYHERDNDSVHPHGGLVRDQRLSRLLSIIEQCYDPAKTSSPDEMPAQAKDLELVQRIREMESTDVFRQALEEGDISTLKHFTGDASQRADVSGLRAIKQLEGMVDDPAIMFYLWAPPGTGKTDFACLLARLWQRHREEQGEDPLIGTNIRTLEEKDQWLGSYGALEEWLTGDVDEVLAGEGQPKLFIFDEASSHAGGSGQQGYEAQQKLGPLLYKIRKYRGSLIIIGHDGRDVHPMAREMATCVHKESLKQATFYEDVRNRRGENELLSVQGIPQSGWRFNDKEATDWRWSDPTDTDDEPSIPDEKTIVRETAIYTAIQAKEQGLTNAETARFVPYSAEWVRQRWNEYRDHGQHTETVGNVETIIA